MQHSVVNKLKEWHRVNGAADNREMLDNFFWSCLLNGAVTSTDILDLTEWCNNTLGNDNWCRQYNKIWFTTEQDLVMFKLMWSSK